MDIQKTYWQNSDSSMALHFPISKVNKEKRTVSGFASLDNIDQHNDIVKAEASKKAFDNFRGNIREMHGSTAVGKMIDFKEDNYFDPKTQKKYNGIYVTAYISKGAQDAWEKCLDGTYTGFSIGGNIKDAKMEKANDGSAESHRVIYDYELHELSLVDSPANQLANFMSIQKNEDGSNFVKGLVAETALENVFWCAEDEIASTSSESYKECVECDHPMINIGWVEEKDIEKYEAVEKVLDSYLKKDEAGAASPDLAGNVINSGSTINTYPDQNTKSKIKYEDGLKKSDNISLNEGGNKMAEDTNTEVVEKAADVETPAEEASSEEVATENTSIEKAATVSEVDDSLDLVKMVSELKAFFEESIKKSTDVYTSEISKLNTTLSEQNSVIETLTKKYEDISKANEDFITKYDDISKSVSDVSGKLDSFDKKLDTLDSATAIQKSVGVSAPAVTKQTKAGWNGAFLGANSI